MGFLAQLGVVVLTQSVARKPFHAKCNIKKPTKNKDFSLNLATFGLARRRPNLQLQSVRSAIRPRPFFSSAALRRKKKRPAIAHVAQESWPRRHKAEWR